MSLGDGRTIFLFWIRRPYRWIIDFRTILAPAKFPNLHEDDSIPPPATRENPGQVTCNIFLWGSPVVDLLVTRFIQKLTPLVSLRSCLRLPLSKAFDCRPVTRGASYGSDKEKEFPQNRYHGNPHHFQSGLKKLDSALNDVITMIEEEAVNLGPHTGNESDLLLKLKGWRQELSTVRTGAAERMEHGLDMNGGVPAELGGIFED